MKSHSTFQHCKTLLVLLPNMLLINLPGEKTLSRFQLVQLRVCKQLSNQKEPFLEEASLLFWITLWELVFPCLVSLRATHLVGLSQINTSLLFNQGFDIFFLPWLIADSQLVTCQRSQQTYRAIKYSIMRLQKFDFPFDLLSIWSKS